MVDALVLAGSPNSGPLHECSPALYEALIDISGKAMVTYVVEALMFSKTINRIVVVGPRELTEVLPKEVLAVLTAGDVLDNVTTGLQYLPDAKKVLMVTSDIPMLTSEAVENFLELCKEKIAELYYPIISKETVEKKYPQAKRTYVHLKEGRFTGGNLMLFEPSIIPGCMSKGRKLINARKHPLQLSHFLGIGFLLKFIFGQVRLVEAERRATGLLGIKGSVVISPYAEIGVDVDKPSDLALAFQQLKTS